MAFAGDFGEAADDEPSRPPLPPEDRLWRHPSELGSGNAQIALDPVAIRRRWLLHQPSRASAWSAGLAGAILATGLVAIGTHLAGAFTSPPAAPASETHHPSVTTGAPLAYSGTPVASGLGVAEQAALMKVGASVVSVAIDDEGVRSKSLGVLVAPNGLIITAAQNIDSGASVVVTTANHVTYVGHLLGTDADSGLAVVRIHTSTALPATPLAMNVIPPVGSVAITLTAPGAATYSWGTVRALNATPRVAGTSLVDATMTDVPSPLGAAVIDASGQLVGVVAASSAGGTTVVPAWLASPVAQELATVGVVANGWLGVDATTERDGSTPVGVRIDKVMASGAAAQAKLHVGDEIVALDGKTISSLPELRGELHALRPGTRARVIFERDGHRVGVTVVLSARPN